MSIISPRWHKVLRDLLLYKTRTILVVLSIAIGVFAFGSITAARENVLRGLQDSYRSINPDSATLTVEQTFDDELVDAIRRMESVRSADGKRSVQARIETAPDVWYDLELHVIPDDGITTVNIVRPVSGAWPPPKHQVLIERSALAKTYAEVGDTVVIEMAGGEKRAMPIAGLTHDLSLPPSPVAGKAFGYISFDTLEWLGGTRGYDQMEIVVAEHPLDKNHIWRVADLAADKIERSGRTVEVTKVDEPLQHPAEAIIQTVLLILGGLGIMALLLSGFLIVNTIGAILAQQIRQIGMMKAVGARNSQIVALYTGMVVAFGILALVLAVPLGTLGAWGFTTFIASQLNFDVENFNLPLYVLGLKMAAALLIPIVTALPVIHSTARITIREALDTSGFSSGQGMGMIDRLIERVRGLPRPLMLSLRNTFRRKARLLRTLAALTLGGAVFISVLTVRASLYETLDESIATKHYDIEARFSRSYRTAEVKREALRVPGVVDAEGWGFATAYPVRSDGSEGESVTLHAPPAGTRLLEPQVIEGRWLLPEDDRAVVISSNFQVKEPGVSLGDEIVLQINGEEHTWRIVGFLREIMPMTNPALAYVNYDAFTRVHGGTGEARSLRIITTQHDAAAQAQTAQALEEHFEQVNLQVRLVTTTADDRVILEERFNLLTAILSIMATLIGTVGGLGLMGTMSINVIERIKEIGIMRAIGATDGALQQIVISEGVLIGVFSWMLGTLFSVPMSFGMSYNIGNNLLNTPLTYTYAWYAVLLWLLIVTLVAALASYMPARSAARVTVREVLAYE